MKHYDNSHPLSKLDGTDPRIILNWFTQNKPKTGIKYKFYELATAKLLKSHQAELLHIILEGLTYGNFTEAEINKINAYGT